MGNNLPLVRTAAMLAGACLVALPGWTQIVTLTDNDSQAQIAVNDPAGVVTWGFLDAQNHYLARLDQQSFYYRIGDLGGETPLSSLGPADIVATPNTLLASYSSPRLTIQASYQLSGGPTAPSFYDGKFNADLAEVLSISNSSPAQIQLHLFQYTHAVLSTLPRMDTATVAIHSPLSAVATQTAPDSSILETVSGPVSHGQAGLASELLALFHDGLPTTLSDNTNAVDGDVAVALEWDLTLAPGASSNVPVDNHTLIEWIPEPSAPALLLTATCAVGLRALRPRARPISRI
jgi:hypothetical protein